MAEDAAHCYLPRSVVLVLDAGGRNEAVETSLSEARAAESVVSPEFCAARRI